MTLPKGLVLVVDDNELNRVLLTTQLQREGYSVVMAPNGRRALDLLTTRSFDVVLLDLMMPEIDGFQVLERIKSDEHLRHIPVIVISALDEMESVVRCIEMGAADHLTKPFDPVLLRARLSASLAAKHLRDQEAEHLAREQRLTQQSQFKSALIGRITHELRSPFVAAGFSVQLLQRYAEHNMQQELREQILQLEQQLAEGRRMIDGVISFATFVGKRTDLRLEEADVARLVEEALTPLRRIAKTRKVVLELAIDEALPTAVVDREQMIEAIHHLVHNAVKFNREGGSARIACHAHDGILELSVADTGRGVAPEQLDSIWDAFSQTADDTQRSVEGLGLGLALVKYVIESHRGEVFASSVLGEGSVFGFRVPLS